MQFFVDTADADDIRELVATGMVDGVTTNPSLIARTGRQLRDVVEDICRVVSGPVSVEVTATDYDAMLAEGRRLAEIAPNITVKVPLTWDGLKTCKALSDNGTAVNVTLCFSVNQALLAAKAGAGFISPFVGRLDDIGYDGMELVGEIREVYDNYPGLDTRILVASIRSPSHLRQAALSGADVATLPPGVLHRLVEHPLTAKGLEAFLADWKTTGQSILSRA